MLNAFFLMFLVSSIYAVLSVELFGDKFPLYFGNFSASFFTMFQMLTGDDWSSVTREMFDVLNEGKIDPGVAFFFCSYIVGCGIILINIVVAVLLDEFIKAVETEKFLKRAKELQDCPSSDEKGSLDPLLACLAKLNTLDQREQKIGLIFDDMCMQAGLFRHEAGRHEIDVRVSSVFLPFFVACLCHRHLYLHLYLTRRRECLDMYVTCSPLTGTMPTTITRAVTQR